MNQVQTPPWIVETAKSSSEIANQKEGKRGVGNPKWVKGGPSPWPAGRPKGSSPQTKLMQRMLEDADGVIEAVISRALDGDTGAAALILSRVVPALKAQAERVSFDFAPDAPSSKQVEQVLQAICDGALAADVGKQIIESIGALSQLRASEDLEARIAALEERQS